MRQANIGRRAAEAGDGWRCNQASLRSLLTGAVVAAASAAFPLAGHAAFDYATGDAEAKTEAAATGTGGEAPADGAANTADPAIIPANRCDVPPEVAPVQDSLPGLVQTFKEADRPLTFVVLGSLSSDAGAQVRGVPGFATRLQAHLEREFTARSLDSSLRVETVGRTRALAGDLTSLVRREVLPLKPALVIWQVGRADARQAIAPSRFSQSLKEGLDILQEAGIAAILADIQFHPQFEALYRTDDYRNYVRWVAGKREVPLLRRYEMIEHWASAGSIDLDSGVDADQQAAYRFIQECLAYQATRMILGAGGLATR